MEYHKLHAWDVTYHEAVAVQQELRSRIRLRPLKKRIRTVAGVDVSYRRGDKRAVAAVVVLSFPEMEVLSETVATADLTFPYVPGLLSFREAPVVLEAFARLADPPDAIVFDGHGLAHPRRFGLASHVGLLLDTPSIGCAKKKLVGEHREPGRTRGSRTRLVTDGDPVGAVVRTRDGVKPVFVSPGHLSDIESAVGLVLQCCTKYRLPDPTRLAHRAVTRARVSGEY